MLKAISMMLGTLINGFGVFICMVVNIPTIFKVIGLLAFVFIEILNIKYYCENRYERGDVTDIGGMYLVFLTSIIAPISLVLEMFLLINLVMIK